MRDEGKSKNQLIHELEALRLQISRLNGMTDRELAWPSAAMAESRLFYSLVSIAASQTSSDEALKQCLDIVCDYLGWPVGHLYVEALDGTDELAPTAIWHLDNPQEFETFREVTEKTRFAPGVGLPGRVLSSGEPAWISDVMEDQNFPRNKLAADLGVHGALGFPIRTGSKAIAVLEFFTADIAEPDDHILDIMRMVGTQFSLVLERKQVEEALRESEDRYRSVVDQVNDAIAINAGDKRVFVNKAFLESHGLDRPSQALGQSLDAFVLPEDRETVKTRREARRKGEGVSSINEYRIRRLDGEIRTVQSSVVTIAYDGQPATLSALRDITDKKIGGI